MNSIPTTTIIYIFLVLFVTVSLVAVLLLRREGLKNVHTLNLYDRSVEPWTEAGKP